MAQQGRSILSILFLVLGLAVPFFFQYDGRSILRGIVDYGKQSEPVNTLLSLAYIKPLSESLSYALRRGHGKWDTHPRKRLLDGMKGYQQYREGRMTEFKTWQTRFRDLPSRERKLIDSAVDYTGKLDHVRDLMQENANIAEAILDYGLQFYNISQQELDDHTAELQSGNVMYALKHIVRDWTTEGLAERATFPCILNAVKQAPGPRVLVPGAALGRLAHEIASFGYEVRANELSAEMILAYRWITSLKPGSNATIYPNVDWWSHRPSTASLTRSLTFPDDEKLLKESVELREGDFIKQQGTYDAIVTYFFIDTARNMLSYLETIHRLLAPGGVWINYGPLLYGSKPSIQLSLDEVISLAETIGLEVETSDEGCGEPLAVDSRLRGRMVPYSADSQSLSRNAYLAQHWTARKRT